MPAKATSGPDKRTSSNNNIKQITEGALIATSHDPHIEFTEPWTVRLGIRTVGADSQAAFILDGRAVDAGGVEKHSNLFAYYKGQHPFGGCYVFHGADKDGLPKKKFSAVDRLVLEIYDWRSGKGDGQIAVGFADAHVALFPVPDHQLSNEEIVKVLSVKGEKSLFGN